MVVAAQLGTTAMTQTVAPKTFATLEEYLSDDNETDARYELVDGMLVEMGAEHRLNEKIALWLLTQFLQCVPIDRIARGTQISVSSPSVTARNPDLMVLTAELDQLLTQKKQSLITPEMPPPLLVVEVVSPGEPGTDNYDRDYVEKPREYAERGIPEYWIIDPYQHQITVLRLEKGIYIEVGVFRTDEAIVSPEFPELDLSADRVLNAGQSGK